MKALLPFTLFVNLICVKVTSAGPFDGSGDHNCSEHFCAASFKSCRCTQDCYKTNDCCLDSLSDDQVWSIINTKNPWQCDEEHVEVFDPWIVDGCPADWGAGQDDEKKIEVQKLCECNWNPENARSMSDYRRVLRVKGNESTYKNVYCAGCNEGVDRQYQGVLYSCDASNVIDGRQALDRNCTFRPSEDYDFWNKRDDKITTCANEWSHQNQTYEKIVKWKCQNYLAPLDLEGLRYGNVFCATCNDVDIENKGLLCRKHMTVGSGKNYSIEKSDFIGNCKIGEIFDIYNKICVSLRPSSVSIDNNNSPIAMLSQIFCLQETQKMGVNSFVSSCETTILRPDDYFINNTLLHVKSSGKQVQPDEYKLLTAQNILINKNTSYSSTEFRPMCEQNYCTSENWITSECSCQKSCFSKGDCCLDMLKEDLIPDVLKFSQLIKLNDVDPRNVITICPSYWTDQNIKRQCENETVIEQNPFLQMPFSDQTEVILFRNVFCAACHGVIQPKPINISVSCRESFEIKNWSEGLELFGKNKAACKIHIDTSLFETKMCPDPFKCNCPKEWNVVDPSSYQAEIAWRCDKYLSPIDANGVVFSNAYCAMCNGVSSESMECYKGIWSEKSHVFEAEGVGSSADSLAILWKIGI